MPPFLLGIAQAVAAAIAYDRIRPSLARMVPRPKPPTFAQGGGRSDPPPAPAGRTYPIWRPPVDRNRRGG